MSSSSNNKKNKLFLFPHANSTVLPDPSKFFSPNLLSKPLPTNSFFQNFVLKNGDQPEYIHPYLIKSSNSSLSLSYPSRFFNSAFIYQIFNADLTITSQQKIETFSHLDHKISSYSDLSVTLDFPSSNLQFFLVRGSPYLTFSVTKKTPFSISTIHEILSFSSNHSLTKHTFHLNNGQTWLLYASSPIELSHSSVSEITASSEAFDSGIIIRIALLPNSDLKHEVVLDRCCSGYPVSGNVVFREPFCLEYKWEKKLSGDMLLLAHPLHVQLLSKCNNIGVKILNDFKYNSIDGELVGVIGSKWVLKTDPVSVTWHSTKGVSNDAHDEIVSALHKDVEDLDSSAIITTSSYYYGKLIARAARLALIAEEVILFDFLPKVQIKKFLKETIEPWLEGTFKGNGFLYDEKWGGIVCAETGADFGSGVYNARLKQLGYFLYGIAVLTKIDPVWGRKYKAQAYALMEDFMNLGTSCSNSNYTCLRCFDLYKLHSWAGGLTESPDGRYQESTSEAVNAYYSAALMGMAYGDANVVSTGSTLTALEIQATKLWWHVKEGGNLYDKEFTKENKMLGVLWSNKRDIRLWFGHFGARQCRLGIHVLPLLPITEVLFSNVDYVKQLVEWALPALEKDGVGEVWKGFLYALQGIYDKECALLKIRKLSGFDDGNSLTNLLWWIHSRG